jgi:predicted  nucleic acid-binding Zn-ribbon protein
MKTVQQLSSLRDTKSLHSIGATSIPKAQRSGHLELYVLESEKNRLEKEVFALDKRRNSMRKQLNGVNDRIEKLQKQMWGKRGVKAANVTSKKPLKTMVMNY